MDLCNIYFDNGKYIIVNQETGETKDFELAKPKATKKATKKVEDNDPTPRLTLLDNKYELNQAAVELLGVEPDDRLNINYEKDGQYYRAVFGTDINFGHPGTGNKLTKSNTVSCRGKANVELARFGSEFTIEPHPDKDGLFILKGEKDVIANNVIDENITVKDDNIDDILDLAADKEDTVITNFDFTL